MLRIATQLCAARRTSDSSAEVHEVRSAVQPNKSLERKLVAELHRSSCLCQCKRKRMGGGNFCVPLLWQSSPFASRCEEAVHVPVTSTMMRRA
jgi:hypothetical protein